MNTKVALFANGWNGENLDFFIEGFNEYFTNKDVDLFVFVSHMLSGYSLAVRDAEESIYNLPDYSFFDAVVVYGSGMNFDDEITHFIEKSKEADVPVVLQGFDVEGIPSVTIDNYVGMKNLCDHLIEKHGVSDVVYIAGDAENGDSNFRLKVLQESLRAHGSELKDENIFYACWNARMIQAYLVETYGDGKKKMPDAFMCANDQMALSTIAFLKQMGVKVPEEVIVSGFDNISAGRVFSPSLATVDQNYQMQGMECAKIVAEVVNNRKLVKKSIIPTRLSPGESCGCIDCKGEVELRKQIGCDNWEKQFAAEVLHGREMHLDMCIMSSEKYEDIHRNMNEDLFKTVGQETEDFHIYVNPQYKELKYMNIQEDEVITPYYNPVMEVIAARTGGVIYEDNVINPKALFLGYDGSNKGKTYAFIPLRLNHSVFGYMVMGYTDKAFEKKKYIEFTDCLKTIFAKYQRNIVDYNHAIKIKEDADKFLQQTVEALVSAVDAKDSYTHGHSARVAKYAKKIAQLAGLSKEKCDDIYLAGLLHDVGKIGISDAIINKTGKLTSEEYAAIKQHSALGDAILEKIHMLPSLSTGARHHHERYDGNGYPDNLKGTDIPQIARIISVADAYDAMTSKRSYRNPIPQQAVREEIIKGIGTQFDPIFAKIMVHLIDIDIEFQMQEKIDFSDDTENTKLSCEEFRTNFAEAVRINEMKTKIHFKYENTAGENSMPAFVLFDSLDARVHKGDDYEKSLSYHEYGELRINGEYVFGGVRKTQIEFDEILNAPSNEGQIELVKDNDHLYFEMIACGQKMTATLCLPDNTRYVYVSITGENCEIYDIAYERATDAIQEGSIERIAEEITYLNGVEGDIPSIQVDGWRTAATEGIMLDGDMEITFDMNSLPFARLIWHCPFFVIFHSDDGKVYGENYIEYSVVRLNGESWSESEQCENYSICNTTEEFPGWEQWKLDKVAGRKSKIYIHKSGNKIVLQTENGGIEIENTTIINDGSTDIYFAFSGDQCTVENIHYHHKE